MNTTMLLSPLVLLLAASQDAPKTEQRGPNCDPSKIEWVLPGQFEKAQQRAAKDQRMLLIKGISFGVDEAGAGCATAGTW